MSGRVGPGGPVLHVDLDEFVAAVEVRRRPELAGLPVVVGGRGDPTERAVVATASYAAREHGVRSGMPLRVAARRCPDAVFLASDRTAYDAASAEVMGVLRDLTWAGDPVVLEVLGWDEAFLAPSRRAVAAGETGDPVAYADGVRRAVLAATDLHCSVGVGDNRLQAKLAVELGKPRGVGVLRSEDWSRVMGPRPTDALWGVGTGLARRLAALGITTVADLGAADPHHLAAELGPTTGPWLRRTGRGVDTSPVDDTPRVAVGHGRERTYQVDLTTAEQVHGGLADLVAQARDDVLAEGRPVVRVGLKIRFAPFTTYTRVRRLPEPTTDLDTLVAAAVSLLARVPERRDDGSRRAVRLLGVRLEMAPLADA
ncbi:DNA polymerase IV [Nocardioides lentus]|uniref:DNA-directed DNA polymerase n=1 Tax=Nocardioides lentus TaxID=338077 RepID=A0ABP5AUJ0_9ACTN